MTEFEKNAEQLDALLWAGTLEAQIFEVMQGTRKPGKLSVEAMVRLIAFARTGSCKNAKLTNPEIA